MDSSAIHTYLFLSDKLKEELMMNCNRMAVAKPLQPTLTGINYISIFKIRIGELLWL
jgi:hypothetical protein